MVTIDQLFDLNMLPFVPLAFIGEYIESYLLNSSGISVIQKNLRATTYVSAVTNMFRMINYIIVIGISYCNVFILVSVGVGDILADISVSKRWPKKVWRWIDSLRGPRKPKMKKIPASTA